MYLYSCLFSESGKSPAHVSLLCFRSDILLTQYRRAEMKSKLLFLPRLPGSLNLHSKQPRTLFWSETDLFYSHFTSCTLLFKRFSSEVVTCCLYACFPWREAIALYYLVSNTWNLVCWILKSIIESTNLLAASPPGIVLFLPIKSWISYCNVISKTLRHILY